MELNEIYPQPNLVIQTAHNILVTIKSNNDKIRVIIVGLGGSTIGYNDTFIWEDEDLKTFLEEALLLKTSRPSGKVLRVTSYNSSDNQILYECKPPLEITKEQIAKKLGMSINDFIIIG